MKLTKYSHACLVLEQDGKSLVIDPGNFSDDFVVPSDVAAVVITHVHPDHCDDDKLQQIMAVHPDVVVYGLAEIVESTTAPVTAVTPGDSVTIDGFELEFTGGNHATIHPDIPGIGNLGIVINRDLLYYPGDSFVQPPRHVQWVATPVAAPWMKLAEAVDFLREAAPARAFPTHDAILSSAGQTLVDRIITRLIDDSIDYRRIKSSETIELSLATS